MTVEAKVLLKVLGDFADQSAEWRLANQEIGRLLVLPAKTRQREGACGINSKFNDVLPARTLLLNLDLSKQRSCLDSCGLRYSENVSGRPSFRVDVVSW